MSILSEGSECGDNSPTSPDGCNRSIKSFSSTSTLDSIALENSTNAPPLPAVMRVKRLELCKQPQDAAAPGWGVKIRGTTSELADGMKVYTCHVESVNEGGSARVSSLHAVYSIQFT